MEDSDQAAARPFWPPDSTAPATLSGGPTRVREPQADRSVPGGAQGVRRPIDRPRCERIHQPPRTSPTAVEISSPWAISRALDMMASYRGRPDLAPSRYPNPKMASFVIMIQKPS